MYTHFRLRFGADDLHGRFVTRQDAEAAVEVHRQYGDDPQVVEVAGHFVPPQRYGGCGTVDSVSLRHIHTGD